MYWNRDVLKVENADVLKECFKSEENICIERRIRNRDVLKEYIIKILKEW